jgi:hypothetical protein
MSSGEVKCWGANEFTLDQADDHALPATIGRVSGASAIGVGRWLDCAVVAGGTVTCWASTSASGNMTAPAIATTLPKASAIKVGGDYACALALDGTVRCWGGNYRGQLGDGSRADSLVPVTVVNLGALAISAGYDHACAVTNGGAIKCWGNNEFGQLGDGSTADSLTPVTVVEG